MERWYDLTSSNYELVLMGKVLDDEDDVAPIDLGDVPERVQPEANREPGDAATTKSTGWKRKSTSPVWDGMDEIFETMNGVRVAANCHYCKKDLSVVLQVIPTNASCVMAVLGMSLCLGSMLMELSLIGSTLQMLL
ncbi:LOW QUALITY PROTEIN: hypothetical protein U9M48_013792, partial [Paspalum notatum var. saurae]